MIQLNYFTSSEFTMGGEDVSNMMDEQFLLMLDDLREEVGFSLKINSSYRSPEYNKSIGGSTGSKHMQGIAIDVHCTDSVRRAKVVCAALSMGLTIGVGKTFIHIDNREGQIMFTY